MDRFTLETPRTGRVDRDEDGYPDPTCGEGNVLVCGNCNQATSRLWDVWNYEGTEVEWLACGACMEDAMRQQAEEAIERENAAFYAKVGLSREERTAFGKFIKEVA